jgi:hypothetical protein
MHGAAGERDGHVGHQVEGAHRGGGHQGEEEVVRVLEAEDAVHPGALQFLRPLRGTDDRIGQHHINF